MNLKPLFEIQRKLDDHIMDEHPELKEQNNLEWKILALQVEIGECANEWRGFKKWSKNQKPRTWYERNCHTCDGKGYFVTNIYTGKKESCGYCDGTGFEEQKNPLLEEYVDCLHFILSIGLELNVQTIPGEIIQLPLVDERLDNVMIMFHQLYACASNLYWSFHYRTPAAIDYIELAQCFLKLGEMLGFTWEHIEQAYMEKNAINHQRQNEGY
ncbi:dUTP diphosphatase [Heyndrickxia oleronia]|uniref:dUTP diphosphatase n=1 Tax=Heyndrickxia oleronia TaxID=38875 RepID=UPI003F24B3D6